MCLSQSSVALIATLWGFVEATFFFVMPDVYLSWLALDRPRLALLACFCVLTGSPSS